MALQTRNHFGAMATEPPEDREDAVSMARRRLIRRETRLRAEVREAGVKDERRFERSGEPWRSPVVSGDPPGEPGSADGN
jgi:hypothetical protein